MKNYICELLKTFIGLQISPQVGLFQIAKDTSILLASISNQDCLEQFTMAAGRKYAKLTCMMVKSQNKNILNKKSTSHDPYVLVTLTIIEI